MQKSIKYKYHYRPGYGSDNLLIEFISGVENENFVVELFDALKNINPKILGHEDLWMNDEILYTIESTLGQFTLSKDNYDLAFIMSENNQACVEKINDILCKDNQFEKIEVDNNIYRKA